MNAFIKASLYIGTILLVGAGGYRFFVARFTRRSRVLLVASIIGFVLLSLGSVANLAQTITNVLGRVDLSFIWQYATSTQHGRMTFLRLGLAVVLIPLITLSRWPKIRAVLFSLAGLGLLTTFSTLSHATTMQGTPAMIADLIHFSSATLWVGAVLFSVLHKVWQLPEFERVMKRVSSLALISVGLLVSTGIYASIIHIKTFGLLFGTEYGRVLLVKIGVFSLILILAALNRWYFMPKLLVKREAFRRVLLLEVFLLIAVLVITGLLTVSPVPHDMTR
jgi:putative copper resistance protein D